MTVEEMKRRKRELGYTNEMLAGKSGVPLGTVQKIFAGVTKSPRKGTLDALERVLRRPEWRITDEELRMSEMLCEPSEAYDLLRKKQGQYTAEDYYGLPAERRCELIDGRFYDMASPSRLHQGILGGVFVQLDECVRRHAGRCFLYMAPSDVQLSGRNVVQPDLYIHCHPENEGLKPLMAAPDFVLEILSPSDPGHDLLRKYELYHRYGVREYWIVDARKKRVVVYDLEADEIPEVYTFEDLVPVRISSGECGVDFREVYARVEHLYGQPEA